MLPVWLTDTVTTDLDRALHYTLLWGLEGVELRTVGGAGDRVPFVNEEKLRRRLMEHEIPLVAIDPGMFEGDASDRAGWLNEVVQLEETLQFCGRVGCERVVVSGFSEPPVVAYDGAADVLRRAGRQAERYGVTLCVLNEAGMTHATGRALAGLLEAVDHPLVQAAWNPAHAVQAGEAPEEGLEALAGRIALVRCADGTMHDGRWEPRSLGEGEVDWLKQLRSLRDQGFDGPLSVEVNMEPRPKHGLRMSTRLIEMIRTVEREGNEDGS